MRYLARSLLMISLSVHGGATFAQEGATKAAFVAIGPEGIAMARVITTADACPALVIDGVSTPMTIRAKPGTEPLRTTRSAPADSKPSEFPVLVCDLALPLNPGSVMLGEQSLPLPKAVPQRIIVVGDTGCRMKKSDSAFQPCNDADKWPWKAVADRAALFKPDLVIHTGDIHYRENLCPENDAGCKGSPGGYGVDALEADLFIPARNLLQAAPWVFVRGNHESCDRAGQGWWRLLDAHAPVVGQDCNSPGNDAKGEFSDPYAVKIAADTQLIVFDSSRTAAKPFSEAEPIYATYKRQIDMANELTKAAPSNIFMNHHPILGFAPKPTPTGVSFYPGNEGLQSVMEKSWPKLLFPPNVNALFSGHNHVFQMTSFSTNHPTQFISGNAGSWVDDPNFDQLPAGATPYKDAVVAEFTTTNQYGFMTMEREGVDWRMREWDRNGALLTSCLLAGSKGKCLPNKVINGGH